MIIIGGVSLHAYIYKNMNTFHMLSPIACSLKIGSSTCQLNDN